MGSWPEIGHNGAFKLESPEPGWQLYLICADGMGEDAEGPLMEWEHVSVSAHRVKPAAIRIPTWKEMCYVKRLCWDAEDIVVQFHPAESAYVNLHPGVLHLWRYRSGTFPTPPIKAV